MSSDDLTTPPAIEYRIIPSDLGYRAGTDGSFWTCLKKAGGPDKRCIPSDRWKRKTTKKMKSGYHLVSMRNKNRLLHQLVLEAFVGPCPEGMEACHNDGNKNNNRPENLRWDTKKSNMADKTIHGTENTGERHGNSKLTDDIVRAIRQKYAEGKTSLNELGRQYGVRHSHISKIVNRLAWKHLE